MGSDAAADDRGIGRGWMAFSYGETQPSPCIKGEARRRDEEGMAARRTHMSKCSTEKNILTFLPMQVLFYRLFDVEKP